MTKAELFTRWRMFTLPEVLKVCSFDDKPARRESWNNYVDAEIKRGRLPHSATSWNHPRGLETCNVIGIGDDL